MRDLVVFGAGGHAKSVAEAVVSAGYEILVFVDPTCTFDSLLGYPVAHEPPQDYLELGGCAVVAIGSNHDRRLVAESLRARFPCAQFPTVVHASAEVSRFATLGHGGVILQGAVVGADAGVGDFVIVNSRASVDHDCVLGDFSSIAPGAVLGGRVSIGTGAAVSMGAVIRQGVRIGDDSVIGANSYVNQDVPASVTAYGTPARIIRSRTTGESYLD